MRRRTTLGLAGALALGLSAITAGAAYSHGYTTGPPSRSANCQSGAASNCGPIQWEPQSVEGPKGFPASGPADGRICAAGNPSWAPLDDPRGGGWPTTQLSSGGSTTVQWRLTAIHATTSFKYFITKDGWDPSKPLTRADLQSNPIYSESLGGARPPADVKHTVPLPSRSGKHMILAVWDIADTSNAFYQCIDVKF
jgi:chitin-binding protein